MTVVDYSTLPAGRETDALVAECVMGHTDIVPGISGVFGDLLSRPTPDSLTREMVPGYSVSIAAAWAIAEHLHANGWAVEINWDGWGVNSVRCIIDGGGIPHRIFSAHADTAPLAICRAALAVAAAAAVESLDRQQL